MANFKGIPVLFYDESLNDIQTDIRFCKGFISDVNNDVRFFDKIEILKDIKEDVRFYHSSVQDINQNIRFYFGVIGDINSDIRFLSPTYKDIDNDIRFYFDRTQDINVDARTVFLSVSDINEDVRYYKLSISDVKEDVRFDVLYYKEFYCNAKITKDATKNFYSAIVSVVQPAPTIPTGLTATDMKKGDLVHLPWNADSNYAYNIYKTAPGGREKKNFYPVQAISFLVGDLTEGVNYTFVVVGVNGAGVESADSVPVSITPTFPDFVGGVTRFQTYTFSVKINNIARTDITLNTVELGYGSSPAVARFSIPKDPETAGLPTHDDEVEVIVNGKSLFKGIIKNIEKSLSTSGMAVSYIAYSKLIYQTYDCATWDEILEYKQLFGIDVSDQTYLQVKETLANAKGNYRLYYDMNTDTIEEYKLGTGYWNRTIIVGKNVLEWNISEDTVNKVTKLTLRGARRKVRTPWLDLTWKQRIIAQGVGWVQYGYYVTIDAFNIGDVQVEAYQSVGSPEITYDSSISVVPTDYGLTQWVGIGVDDPIASLQNVTSYRNPVEEWRSAGTDITYQYEQVGDEQTPISALIVLSSAPKIYRADVHYLGNGVRLGRTPSENINFNAVKVAGKTNEFSSPFRISYSYEQQDPTEVPKGTGTPSRSVTDTQYKQFNDQLEGEDDTSIVLSQMDTRAEGELDKLNRPIVSGRIQILGDENFNLKTLVDINGEKLDVIRVTHNFGRGFTTDLELTNERFRINVPSYQEMRRRVDYERRVSGTQSWLDYYKRALQQALNTNYTDQPPPKDQPKSPFAIYGD